MPNNNEEINLARLVYDAYPHSDLLPIDPEQDCDSLESLWQKVTTENIGDSLFQFLIVEMIEGGESTLAGAIKVLEQARTDIAAAIAQLKVHIKL